MVFTITTTTTTRNRRGQCGRTLPEMMVGVSVSTLVLTAVAALFLYQAKTCAALGNYVDLDQRSRYALDLMEKEIRQANRLTSVSATNLSFEMIDADTGATNTLSYSYNAGTKTLVRSYLGVNRTLLTEIMPNSVKFSLYQRNPVGGEVGQYATTDPSLCKVVQFSWICSRPILGATENTESVQSAKVVIRKE
jgi:hypothetical protein